MTDTHQELEELARIVSGLVQWDLEEDALGYAVSSAQPAVAGELPPTRQERPILSELRAELGDCTRCKLCELGRQSIVFGEGNPAADLVFVGEGPGYHEDQQGRPFVGKAGALLDKMIQAMGLSRNDVYICNVVKCRPPENRDPEADEIVACQPFLQAQLRAIEPRVVVALGRFASQTLLNTTDSLGTLRGRFHPFFNASLMPTYHPAYLLRNPADKRKAWEDLQAVMSKLGLRPS